MTPWWEAGLRLLLASVLGGVVGWQRESADKPAGFRTHIIVCLGAALFTLVSAVGFFGSGADPARVASNIVVGIGFLGAGTIWRTGGSVQGLTTAASLWTVAAIGTATSTTISSRGSRQGSRRSSRAPGSSRPSTSRATRRSSPPPR